MRLILLVLIAFVLFASGAAAQSNPAFGCRVNAGHAFKNAKFYNGTPGGQEYDLAPDDTVKHGKQVVLSWDLKNYRDLNLFMRCYYFGTDATPTENVPAAVTKCAVTLELTATGEIVGKSELKCQ